MGDFACHQIILLVKCSISKIIFWIYVIVNERFKDFYYQETVNADKLV